PPLLRGPRLAPGPFADHNVRLIGPPKSAPTSDFRPSIFSPGALMSVSRVCSLALLSLIGLVGVACAAHEAFTDPATAGPDFAVQGEYAGEGKFGDDTKKVGVQVVALGDHEFDATAFVGGLPGDGWSRGDKTHAAKGKMNGDVVEISDPKGGTGTIKDGTLTVMDGNGNKIGELKKIERKSPTLGAKPPEGAIVLFDGTNADAWKNGKLV